MNIELKEKVNHLIKVYNQSTKEAADISGDVVNELYQLVIALFSEIEILREKVLVQQEHIIRLEESI